METEGKENSFRLAQVSISQPVTRLLQLVIIPMGALGRIYGIEAGFCAAFASVWAKLATSADIALAVVQTCNAFLQSTVNVPHVQYTDELSIAVRVLAVAGIILSNALMWVLFTKAMHLCSSTVEATAFNTASNFFFTAALGYLLFGERLGLQWALGSTLMVLGLLVMHRADKDSEQSGERRKSVESSVNTRDRVTDSKKES